GVALNDQADIRSPRASFGSYPRREIHLYRSAVDMRAHKPALTIYYLGVPDTTPEFKTKDGLESYFAVAIGRGR
ncbi:MAG TPA: hypothetical protein VFN71_06160, partial [Methylomirabilota bacterium]|nr:hypothetical protein [Methylomirabilota bacterium]